MYHSPVPLLIIRADAPSLIEVNGNPAGECGRDAHVALPLSGSGDYYIAAQPLCDLPDARLYPVLRKLSFAGGSLSAPPAPDVSVCAWPGGVFELTLRPGRLRAECHRPAPYRIDRIEPRLGGRTFSLTLYYENGLKLSIEENGSPLGGFALGEGESGTLGLTELSGRDFIAVRALRRGGERLLLLDANMEEALDLSAAAVHIEGGELVHIDPLGTLLGHERRVRYAFAPAEGFRPLPAEVGFFTHAPRAPKGTLERAIAFAEAVRENLADESMSYLTDDLRATVGFAALREFLGDFTAARPPLSDASGRYLGLIAAEGENLSAARLYELEFAQDGRIENITEV